LTIPPVIEAPSLAGAREQTLSAAQYFLLFCVSHFVIDLYSIGLGTYQPLLVDKLGLTLSQAGLLAGLFLFSSSLTQPVYGILADRFPVRHFTMLAPLAAASGVALLGLAGNFWTVTVLVLMTGAGIASYHPQATAHATLRMRSHRARWMAIFISSGTMGMALGPAFFSGIVERLHFDHSYWAAVPGVVMAGLLWLWLPQFPDRRLTAPKLLDFLALGPVRRLIAIHFGLVFVRSVVQVSFAQLLPLYLVRERGHTVAEASVILVCYLGCGALGGFTGGQLSDWFGGKRVILVSMAGCIPFMAVFFLTSGWVSTLGLALGGWFLLFTIPVNVTMAQDLVPAQAQGTVSSLMMGFAWGSAGLICLPVLGAIADATSLKVALAWTLLFPALGMVLTLALPKDGRTRRAEAVEVL
jgi:FSR family fosmidomycin resistance protein-like MFS transporter